jgi:hypothetical protein
MTVQLGKIRRIETGEKDETKDRAAPRTLCFFGRENTKKKKKKKKKKKEKNIRAGALDDVIDWCTGDRAKGVQEKSEQVERDHHLGRPL